MATTPRGITLARPTMTCVTAGDDGRSVFPSAITATVGARSASSVARLLHPVPPR
ncbi:hypothetical protein [Methylobacterium sp. E-045]|uniref:hypothetical protein n=1 Tax=Methylobacterium sp. E-045 TaxID=2836575 RepID=UPI001FBA6E30|nr:hypothetical protein [Methylobacterium sp. E-045]MCJ2131926.1 hypothetical protein [Methylobacterium sp. E-045]